MHRRAGVHGVERAEAKGRRPTSARTNSNEGSGPSAFARSVGSCSQYALVCFIMATEKSATTFANFPEAAKRLERARNRRKRPE